jgi:hypothetical protein
MLREEAVVERALRQFLPVVRAGVPLDVVVVCTMREAGHGTRDAARRVSVDLNGQAGRDAFFVVDAPPEQLGKVGQLNAGFAWWMAHRHHAAHDVYVGVYDADSTPDPAVFAAIARIVADRRRAGRPAPDILQQVSCYCQNVHELSGFAGAVSAADALAQSRWAIGFEFPLYEGYGASVRRFGLRRLVYCVGHGCFVSLPALERIEGFPTCSPNDDLALGYLASLVGLEVVPLPVLDYCDVAPRPLATVRQSQFWYLGSARFHQDLAYFEERFGVRPERLQRLWLHVDGRLRNVFWAWRAMLWLTALVFAVATGSWALAATLLAAHVCYVQLGALHTLSALRRLPGAARRVRLDRFRPAAVLAMLAAASLTFVLRGVGPMLGSLDVTPRHEWKQER